LELKSLFRDLSAFDPDAVRFYARRKTVTQRRPSAKVREGVEFVMPTMK
jgi:malonate-semialdehyde dehydrogenase (acetylating)/methylmalonate-semialdehyde dehydrogenase